MQHALPCPARTEERLVLLAVARQAVEVLAAGLPVHQHEGPGPEAPVLPPRQRVEQRGLARACVYVCVWRLKGCEMT